LDLALERLVRARGGGGLHGPPQRRVRLLPAAHLVRVRVRARGRVRVRVRLRLRVRVRLRGRGRGSAAHPLLLLALLPRGGLARLG